MTTSGKNFSSIGPLLHTKTLAIMEKTEIYFWLKKRMKKSEKKNRSNTCPLIFRALSMVKIWAQSDLPFSRSGKVKKEGRGTLKVGQSAVVLAVHQALEAVSAVHCQERNEINNHRKENRDRHYRKKIFFYPQQYLLQELEINHHFLRWHFRKKMLYLADHHLEKKSD